MVPSLPPASLRYLSRHLVAPKVQCEAEFLVVCKFWVNHPVAPVDTTEAKYSSKVQVQCTLLTREGMVKKVSLGFKILNEAYP